jgi:diguanylate cyclase (GGDEF)-like protein
MPEKKFIKLFRRIKITQTALLCVIDIIFLAILFGRNDVTVNIFDSPASSVVAVMLWILMLFSLAFIVYDVYTVREFAKESHALNKTAFLDGLTGIPNRLGLDLVLQTYPTAESREKVGCAIAAIDNINEVNTTLGYKAGDCLIQEFGSILENVGDRYGIVARNSGNVYLAVIDNCDRKKMDLFFSDLDKKISDYNANHTDAPIKVRTSSILNSEVHADSFTKLFKTLYRDIGI